MPRALADRLLDRRAAGADGAVREADRGDRSRAGADHATHAADFHHGARRASARASAAAARMKPRMASRFSPAASMSRRAAAICACCATATDRQDRAHRRSADQFLPAFGRSVVLLGGRGLGRRPCWRWFSPAWALTARRVPPISSPPAAASSLRTKRRAWFGACRARSHRPDCARQCCRSIRFRPKVRSSAAGEPVVTPLDYDFLRSSLKRALRPRAFGRQAVSGREPARCRSRARPALRISAISSKRSARAATNC